MAEATGSAWSGKVKSTTALAGGSGGFSTPPIGSSPFPAQRYPSQHTIYGAPIQFVTLPNIIPLETQCRSSDDSHLPPTRASNSAWWHLERQLCSPPCQNTPPPYALDGIPICPGSSDFPEGRTDSPLDPSGREGISASYGLTPGLEFQRQMTADHPSGLTHSEWDSKTRNPTPTQRNGDRPLAGRVPIIRKGAQGPGMARSPGKAPDPPRAGGLGEAPGNGGAVPRNARPIL